MTVRPGPHQRAEDVPESDQVARAAGVGKGTLFRHFGDRCGLMRALLDERERSFQEGFIRGPAPFGPGAPARERLVAFGEQMLEHVVELRPRERAVAVGPHHFAPEAEPAINRADVHKLQEATVGVAMHHAFDRRMRLIADRIGPLVRLPEDDDRERAATGMSLYNARERSEELDERKRLLYVATTRERASPSSNV